MRRRLLSVLLAAGALALAAPAAAGAATVGISGFGPTLWYQAATGATNDLTVSYDSTGDNYVFTDPGETSWTVNTGCTQTGPSEVTCAASGLRWVYVTLNDMDDHATLAGMGPASPIVDGDAGNDVLTGGPGFDQLDGGAGDDTLGGGGGADRLDGGDGNDQIAARDDVGDQILCGTGIDSVTADASDYQDGSCETFDVPAPPPAQSDPEPAPAPPAEPRNEPAPLAPTAEELLAGPAPVKLDQQVQEVAVKVSCPAERVGGCEGTLSVSLVGSPTAITSARSARRGRAPLVKLASKKIKVAAGKTKTVKAHLSRRGRSLLTPPTTVARAKSKRSGRRRVTAVRAQVRISVSLRQPDGSLQTSSHDVSVKIPVKRAAPKTRVKARPRRKPAKKPTRKPKPISPLTGLKNLL